MVRLTSAAHAFTWPADQRGRGVGIKKRVKLNIMGHGGGTDSVAVGVVDVLGANPKVCRLPVGTAEQDA